MEDIPTINSLGGEGDYAKYEMTPLASGLGITVGNALRRVLLNDIMGCAVSDVYIDGVDHEYSTMPGVVEDTLEILLNLKEMAILVAEDADTTTSILDRATIDVRGEGEVTAADVQFPLGFKAANPSLHIATLTQARASLRIDMSLSIGKGWRRADQVNRSTLPIGVIPVDAVYAPVKKVNYAVDPTRVGAVSNFDRLVLEIWTNGAVEPDQALAEAASHLMDHFRLFAGLGPPRSFVPVGIFGEEEEVIGVEVVEERDIMEVGLKTRTVGLLQRNGIDSINELTSRTEVELEAMEGVGPGSLEEINAKLSELGLALSSEDNTGVAGESEAS